MRSVFSLFRRSIVVPTFRILFVYSTRNHGVFFKFSHRRLCLSWTRTSVFCNFFIFFITLSRRFGNSSKILAIGIDYFSLSDTRYSSIGTNIVAIKSNIPIVSSFRIGYLHNSPCFKREIHPLLLIRSIQVFHFFHCILWGRRCWGRSFVVIFTTRSKGYETCKEYRR